jgi:Protein of unknown function (DUF4240)
MDDDTFWAIIEASKAEADPMSMDEEDHQPAVLTEMLKALSPEEVCAFDATFRRLHHQAYRWDLWAAAYIILGGCSDDGFMDFRSGLIGLGKKAYYDALADPNTLALQPDRGVDFSQEALKYASSYAYEALTDGEEMPVDPSLGLPPHPAGEDDWDEDNVEEKYPVLAKRFARR